MTELKSSLKIYAELTIKLATLEVEETKPEI